MADQATFRIWRGDNGAGKFVDYTTEISSGMVVLDAVHQQELSRGPRHRSSAIAKGVTWQLERRHERMLASRTVPLYVAHLIARARPDRRAIRILLGGVRVTGVSTTSRDVPQPWPAALTSSSPTRRSTGSSGSAWASSPTSAAPSTTVTSR